MVDTPITSIVIKLCKKCDEQHFLSHPGYSVLIPFSVNDAPLRNSIYPLLERIFKNNCNKDIYF